MRKKSNFIGLFVGILMLLYAASPVWAEVQLPEVKLELDKTNFVVGEPVGLTATVSYDNGYPPLLITTGFQNTIYYLEMRVIDPAGELLLARRDEEHIESPDAPPLGYIYYNGRFIRGANCEVLDPVEGDIILESRSEDIRQYYDIGLPGNYSVQVQISAVIYRGTDPENCNIKDYEFKGVLKSETKYFFVEGSIDGVKVIPDQWSTKWINPDKKASDIQVHIWPMEGETTADYKPETFRLNGIEPSRVKDIRAKTLKPMLKAYFPARDVMETLGTVLPGQWYTVFLKGEHKVGEDWVNFGRFQQIRISN